MSAVQLFIQPLSTQELMLHERALFQSEIYVRTEADLLATIAEVDRIRLYLKFDLNSTFSYCLKFLKLSPAVTSNFINVARKSREVPELQLAVESGDLSVATARKIVPVLNKANQQAWIEKAKGLPQHRLEREIANEAPGAREFERARPIKDGRVKIELSVSDEAMAEIRKAQDLVSSKTRGSASLEDTIMTAVREYNERNDPLRRAQRKQSKKTANMSQTHAAASKPKRVLGKSDISKLAMYKRVVRMRTMRRRAIPASVQHAVNLRDQRQCQALRADGSKCLSTRFLHTHHKIELAQGGLSTFDNVTTLCSRCHRLWHLKNELAI